nr:ATP-binding cassette domain-containing protein [Paenibacillus tyrfis]
MIELHNLTIRATQDHRTLIQDFQLSLQSGDKIAIIGEEGNGKSTLLKFIYDEHLIADYCTYEGNLGIDSLVSEKKLGVLSGGERFKYRFLRLLALDPDILLLDEPTNDLDIRTMEWLEVFIREAASSAGCGENTD